MKFFKTLSDSMKLSSEVRSWKKLQLRAEDIKKAENYTLTLNRMHQALASLNSEMREFNQNITQSNTFLRQIADLQKSMEKQTKTAKLFTWVVVALAALQVIIAVIPYRASILNKLNGLFSGGKIDFGGIPLFIILGIGWIVFGIGLGIWYKFSSNREKDTINAIAIVGGFVGIGTTVLALALQAP
jgi:FtsH-binding integral membrane protein